MTAAPLEQQAPERNPIDNSTSLAPESADDMTKVANPQADILPGDSATTRAEKIERHGATQTTNNHTDFESSPSKRRKLNQDDTLTSTEPPASQPGRVRGIAPIKKEYLVDVSRTSQPDAPSYDDDAAEASGKTDEKPMGGRGGQKTKGGQNHNRQFGSSRDAIELCKSRTHSAEFEPVTCRYGEKCRYEHDIRRYLTEGKRADLDTFGPSCPLFEGRRKCPAGWRCRFAKHHSKEIEREDGRRELVPIVEEKEVRNGHAEALEGDEEEMSAGVVNVVSHAEKIKLRKKQFPTIKADKYTNWLNTQNLDPTNGRKVKEDEDEEHEINGKSVKDGEEDGVSGTKANGEHAAVAIRDRRAQYVEPPFRASEKRRIYYGPETPVLAPLTTQGNLPFRRLCVSLGAQITWSEMAMGVPLLQGDKGEWALMKAHESELAPLTYRPTNIVHDYDPSKDLKFGAQIAANKPWLALKTTEVLTSLCPHLRAIDLNCGCPLDLVCRQGAGSSLLDVPGKLEKTLRGMNAVSGETPITVKIRMGTRDKQPTADKLCQRLVLGGPEAQDYGQGPAGVAAITLHGRSKQQRYTRSADWDYIASCAALVKKLKAERDRVADTVREPDARDLPVTSAGTGPGLPYFCGNGDILSHVDYNTHLATAGVDGIMIGRGALIKPWIFEEIAANQYLDKSASERLTHIERFVRNGLEYWGADEIGVGTTRRFLLEWLSFTCRYVPIGLLEYLPPKFGDRPPAFRGRSDLETLLCSGNYKDWIRISEMFLGPAHKDFKFQPKHKSNSYEIEAEG